MGLTGAFPLHRCFKLHCSVSSCYGAQTYEMLESADGGRVQNLIALYSSCNVVSCRNGCTGLSIITIRIFYLHVRVDPPLQATPDPLSGATVAITDQDGFQSKLPRK